MSIRKSLAWTFLGQGLYFVIQYGGSVALARLLAPEDMGVYAIALSTMGVLALLNAWGLYGFVVREKDLTPERFGTAVCVNAMLAGCMGLAIYLTAAPMGAYMRSDGVAHIMHALSFTSILGALEFPSSTLLCRDKRFKPLAIIQAARAALTAAVTIVMALQGESYMSLAWGTLSGNVLGLVCMTAVARPAGRMVLSLSAWREVTRFGTRMFVTGGVIGVAARAPEFILGRLLGMSSLGLYNRASGLLDMARDNVYNSLTHVLVPSLAEHNRTHETLRPIYRQALAIITGLFWPAFGGLAILAGPMIYWVYGPKWVAAAPILSLLCVAQMVHIAMSMTGEVFVIKDELDRQMRIEIVRAVCMVGLFYVGATWGMQAAAASRMIEAAVTVALYAPHMRRMTGLGYRNFAAIYGRSLKLVAAALAPAAILMQSAGWRHDVAPLHLAGCIVAGIVAWVAAAFFTAHPIADEIRKVAQAALAAAQRAHPALGRLAPQRSCTLSSESMPRAAFVAPAEIQQH